MGKIILICGKICSGKSYYAKQLKLRYNAIILSTDEATFDLINNEQGEFYNIFAKRVNQYLTKKAVETVRAGANVILDWGFWTKKERIEISELLRSYNIQYEWHYIDVADDAWRKNITERNNRILNGEPSSDFYVDDELLKKLLSMFETPEMSEIDVWYRLNR